MSLSQIIKNECYEVIRSLVNHGEAVCDSFEARPESTYFCVKCGYSQYIHLAKQIAKAKI